MTQTELTLRIIDFIERVNSDPDRFCGMLAPRFIGCNADEMSIELGYTAQSWEENPLGIIHGGIVIAMMDSALGVLASAICGGKSVTVSLQTSFLRAVYAGDRVNVCATVTYAGRSIVHCEAKAYREGAEHEPVASASAVFKPIAPV